MNRDIIPKPIKFEWDRGNKRKNPVKHGIENEESESVFFDKNSVFAENLEHSKVEERFQIVGKSGLKNILNIIFTVKKEKVRIISARMANKKERKFYESKKNK